MKQEINTPQRLEGFQWLENKRPLSIIDILKINPKLVIFEQSDIIPDKDIKKQSGKIKIVNDINHE